MPTLTPQPTDSAVPQANASNAMLGQEDNADQFAPAQVVAQVAPPSPPPAPLPGAHTKPQSDADIAPEPAVTLPLSSRSLTATSESDSIPCPVMSAAGVDSLEGALLRTHTKLPSVFPIDDRDSTSEAAPDHQIQELRPQEETHVDNTRPITPPLSQDGDTGVSTTSSVTPLRVVDENLPNTNILGNPVIDSNTQKDVPYGHVTPNTPPSSEDRDSSVPVTSSNSPLQTAHLELLESSPYDTTTLPTPSSTHTTSRRGSLSPEFSQDAIDAHYKRAKGIYGKTRYLMCIYTKRMSIVASRGFQCEYLPMRRARPPLRKRRYSVDVNTTQDWPYQTLIQDHFMLDVQRQNHETDPVALFTTVTDPVPDAFRYPALGFKYQYYFPPLSEDVYLRLGDAVLRTDAYEHIGLTDGSYETWMTGDSLDMAMEVLSRDEPCHAHNIAIANSAVAQICYFAYMSDDTSPQEYNEYKIQYEDKRWIFIVINDAIGGIENDRDQGTHWSFIALDRERKTIHYYDSMWDDARDGDSCYSTSGKVSTGMLKILGEDVDSWKYSHEHKTPNQMSHNRFTSDGGACGPFVFKMMQHLIRRIVYWQCFDHNPSLELEDGFQLWFRDSHFDSQLIRREIQVRIARWRAIIEGKDLTDRHEKAVPLDEDVVLEDAPEETFWYPWRSPSVYVDGEKNNFAGACIDREMDNTSTTGDTVLATSSDPMEVDMTLEDAETEDEYDGRIHNIFYNNSDEENGSSGLVPCLVTPSISDEDEDYNMWD